MYLEIIPTKKKDFTIHNNSQRSLQRNNDSFWIQLNQDTLVNSKEIAVKEQYIVHIFQNIT
jgi:hypothetical protein